MRPRPAVLRPLAILAALAWCGPLAGQAEPDPIPAVESARMSAVVTSEGGEVDVRIEYRLRRPPGRAPAPVRIHALGVGDAWIDGFRVESGGSPVQSPALTQEQGVLRSALVELPDGEGDGIVLSYRVANAVERTGADARVRLPVLVLDLPLAETAPSTFRTAVTVPDGWAVSGTFPSGLTRADDGSWSGALQVVPAFVSLRARTDGSWRPGLPWALDLATVLVLAVVSFLGWRHLSGVVREARA